MGSPRRCICNGAGELKACKTCEWGTVEVREAEWLAPNRSYPTHHGRIRQCLKLTAATMAIRLIEVVK